MTTRQKTTQRVTSDQAALLAAIIQHPDEDAPRLMYADLLDEIGGGSNRARAEFIRAQIGLEQTPRGAPEYQALSGRASELLRVYTGEWLSGLCFRIEYAQFRRGFVESVTANPRGLARHGERLFQSAPVVEINLIDVGGDAGRLARCGWLARLQSLSLSTADNTCSDATPLLGSPQLAGLRRLSLDGGITFDPDGVPAGAGRFPSLRVLSLPYRSCFCRAVRTAHLGTAVPALRALNLRGHEFDDNILALTDSPLFGRLRQLGLEGSDLTDAGAAALASAPSRGGLRYLDVSYTCVGDDGLRALAAGLPGVDTLSVRQYDAASEPVMNAVERTPPQPYLPAWYGDVSNMNRLDDAPESPVS